MIVGRRVVGDAVATSFGPRPMCLLSPYRKLRGLLPLRFAPAIDSAVSTSFPRPRSRSLLPPVAAAAYQPVTSRPGLLFTPLLASPLLLPWAPTAASLEAKRRKQQVAFSTSLRLWNTKTPPVGSSFRFSALLHQMRPCHVRSKELLLQHPLERSGREFLLPSKDLHDPEAKRQRPKPRKISFLR